MPDMATSLIKGELISDSTPVEVVLGDINSFHIEAVTYFRPDVKPNESDFPDFSGFGGWGFWGIGTFVLDLHFKRM